MPFLASALTFDALLAAIPLLLLLLVGLTHLARLSASATSQDLHALFMRIVPQATAGEGGGLFTAVERGLAGFTRARATVSLYATPLFLWFATRLFASIRTSLTLVYDVPRRPEGGSIVLGYLGGKLRDTMMVVLTVILVAVNAVLTTGIRLLDARGHALVGSVPLLRFLVSGVGYVITELLAFGSAVWLFYLVFRHASPRRLPRRAALAGSLFTAVLFEVARRLYSWYLHHLAVVGRFSTDANIGALLLFVGWLYYTALVFLVGAVVAETWDLRARQRRAATPG